MKNFLSRICAFTGSLLSVSMTLVAVNNAPAADLNSLEEHLEGLRPFLGKTWRGEFKNSKAEKPTIDVARWERALNGKAVRVLHSVNDGTYGGESLAQWDKQKNEIRYYYFTTAGFSTVGTMTVAGRTITAVETMIGSTNSTTEVRSTYELLPDGSMLNKSRYFKNGEAAGSREVLYKEDSTAVVKFQ